MSYQLETYDSSLKLSVTFICLILLSSLVLVGSNLEVLSIVSKFATYSVVILLFLIYLSKVHRTYSLDWKIFFLSLLSIWMGVRSINIYGFGLFIQSFLLLISCFFLYNFKKSFPIDTALNISGYFFIILSFTHFYIYPIFINTNYIGVCGLIFLVSFLSQKKIIPYFLSLICIIIIIFSGTRSVLLGILIAFFIYRVLKLGLKMRFFSLIALGAAIFLFIHYGVYDYLNSDSFAQLVIDKTGKRLESGRVEIWTLILARMDISDYIIGFGGGTNYINIIGSELSAHSGYIYILSSYGMVGLILFLAALLSTALSMLNQKYYYSFILFVALVFRELFEVTLIHNSFPIALFFWAFLSNGYIDRSKAT